MALSKWGVYSYSSGKSFGYNESSGLRFLNRSIVSESCVYMWHLSQPIQTLPTDIRLWSSSVLFYQYKGNMRNGKAVRNAQCFDFIPEQPCWVELSLRFFVLLSSWLHFLLLSLTEALLLFPLHVVSGQLLITRSHVLKFPAIESQTDLKQHLHKGIFLNQSTNISWLIRRLHSVKLIVNC